MRIFTILLIVMILSPGFAAQVATGEGRALPSAMEAGAIPVTIARDKTALHAIVTAPDAGSDAQTAARELSEYFQRISGAAFDVGEGDGTRGIAVGGVDEFPHLDLAGMFSPDDPFRREEYLIRSHDNGLYLIGATPAAARLAVWDLLFRLGHRQFFPGDKWEIVPSVPEIQVALDRFNKPDYVNRRIWRGGQQWNFTNQPFQDWRIRNRSASGAEFILRTQHVYGSIIRNNRETFDANPAFYAKINGTREYVGGNTKFCIANEGLRDLVVEDAIRRVRDNPETDSISMDPSDGGNWCQCGPCADMGSVSDRVTLLANQVAEAINDLGMGDKYVGIYAYASHSPPPSVRVHPKVIVSVATSFLRDGFSAPDLVEAWANQGAVIGLREYYAISIWHKDLPGRARAVDFPYLQRTIPFFHANGARFNSANIGDSWGAYGLGFYLIAHLLFDVENANRMDLLIDDFLGQSFGPARDAMERFYRLICRFDATASQPLFSEHLIAQMYRRLDEALQAADGQPEVIDRIHDLILYTRYAELYLEAEAADGAERQRLGEELLRHMHAIRHSMMVATRVMTRGARRRLPSFTLPTDDEWDRIQTIDSYSPEQIRNLLAEGIANNIPIDFEPVAFSRDLVPAAEALDFPDLPAGSLASHAPRARRIFYTWVEEPGPIVLRVQGGMIRHFRDRGNVRITLHSPLDELVEGVAHDESVPPDGEWHRVELETPFTGLHWIDATDGDDATFIFFEDDDLPYVIPSGREERYQLRGGRWSLYFYVPKGTETLGGFVTSNRAGTILDGDGNDVFDFTSMEQQGYFSVAVPEDQDGRLWKVSRAAGQCYLMTVPPYYARTPREMLLPREVVERDRKADE